jgi:NADP-dependent 3-hydroxy acid dehydrogenase YdfG
MIIAITGHTAGIGQAMANEYTARGHTVLGFSRRNGHNIRSVPKIAGLIEPCDVFVNNAQAGFAQTELLFEMARRWQGSKKQIIVISTIMTQDPVSVLPGLGMTEYRIQKVALEESVKQLRHQKLGIGFRIVRPGKVNTQGDGGTDPALWAKKLLDILDLDVLDVSLQ